MAAMSIHVTAAVLLAVSNAGAAEPIITIDDPDGAAGRVAAPVCVEVDLTALADGPVRPDRLRLVELSGGSAAGSEPLAVQFEPAASRGKGKLWWLLTPGAPGQRRFRLVTAERASPAEMSVHSGAGQWTCATGSFPCCATITPACPFRRALIRTTNGGTIFTRCAGRTARR